MSTTGLAIAREMIARGGPEVGRLFTPTAMAAQTVTVGSLATGGDSSQKYENQYMVRRESATTADRVRKCKGTSSTLGFNSASGLFTHQGTAYSDTTVGSELFEVWPHEQDLVDRCIQLALSRLHFRDVSTVPTRGNNNVSLDSLSWIQSPGEVLNVGFTARPVLIRNANFEKWFQYSTGGVLQPDAWTLAGSGATVTRSTTANEVGAYTAAFVRSGTNATLSQTIGILGDRVSADSLRGRTVGCTLTVQASSASQVRVQILEDGAVTASSSYHTGGGKREELTASTTILSTTDSVSIQIAHVVDGTVYVERCVPYVGTISDTIRRDDYEDGIDWVRPEWEQGGTLMLKVPRAWRGVGNTVHIASWRPFPQFDSARSIAGSCDADASDAPVRNVAVEAIARLFSWYAEQYEHRDNEKYQALAALWRKEADQLNATYMHIPAPIQGGVDIMPPLTIPTVRSW